MLQLRQYWKNADVKKTPEKKANADKISSLFKEKRGASSTDALLVLLSYITTLWFFVSYMLRNRNISFNIKSKKDKKIRVASKVTIV